MGAEWSTRCLLARVRCLALREQALAGGEPTAWQLTRAIAPVLGDLLPLPSEGDRDPAARPGHVQAAAKWDRLDAGAAAGLGLGCAAGASAIAAVASRKRARVAT